MSRVSFDSPTSVHITVPCCGWIRSCGEPDPCDAGVIVERMENGTYWVTEHACENCGREFTKNDDAELIHRATEEYDNYDPTDQELRAAGLLE